MIKTEILDINKIVKDKSVLKLFHAVNSHGGVLRFVGGAVRDVLAGHKGFELDLATDLSPDELVEACQDCGLKTVHIGLKYATTGVIINNKVLEVSSLRKSNEGYKYSSEFDFTDDWSADASKRDLTINAVYADERGNVFDYYNGVSDLENGIIRFIGRAENRIKENPIRIMRFFRFYSIFGKGLPDLKSLKACVENKDLLRTVAVEQIRDEFFKILITPNAAETLRIMFENSLLDFLLPVSDKLEALSRLSALVAEQKLEADALRRLFLLYMPDPGLAENLAARLRLTKIQKNKILQWAKYDFDVQQALDDVYLRRVVYMRGKDFCKDKALFSLAYQPIEDYSLAKLFERIDQIELPEFPIKGADLLQSKLCTSLQMGETLDLLKKIWIDSDFSLERAELLAYVLES